MVDGLSRQEYLWNWRAQNKRVQHLCNTAWYTVHGKAHYEKNKRIHHENYITSKCNTTGLTRSEIMARIKSVSMVEKAGRALAEQRANCRLIHQPSNLFGKPDYANKTKKIAVFIHGCWWHVCPIHFKLPKTRPEWWRKKFQRNVDRHIEVERALKQDGYRVIVIWEHEVRAWQRAQNSQ